jgi:GMP synthase (glutamine-hydrolysing)
MNIHWIQHVEFEGLGCIGPWLEENGHSVSCSRLWAGDRLPAPEAVDGLIVMGGPMGIYDEELYPWLVNEKRFIKAVIEQELPVLGICLGAQLIADVLGAEVRPGPQKEIGFFPILGKKSSKGWNLPSEFWAFHWHGDTFDIPEGAVRLASSEVTENQAFLYKDHVLALQFHLETTESSLMSLYENCSGEIVNASFIQTLEQMRPFFPRFGTANGLMFQGLEALFG